MRELLLRLVDHMRWADGLVADALERDEREDHRSTEAVQIFAHVAATVHVWYARMLGQTPEHAIWPALSPAESRALAARNADLFAAAIGDADDGALRRVVSYSNTSGRAFQNTVADIVTHVSIHGEHHRGQIARLVRAAGGEPPYTDFIQFARRNQ